MKSRARGRSRSPAAEDRDRAPTYPQIVQLKIYDDRFRWGVYGVSNPGVEEQNPPNPALSDEHRAVTSAAWTYR